MKKFTLLFVALLVATLTFAQKANVKVPAPLPMKQLPVAGKVTNKRTIPVGKSMAPRKAASDYVIISEQPEGELVTYSRGGGHYFAQNGNLYYGDQSGSIDVVFAADNKVYFKDIVSGLQFGTWVEGTLNEEGTQITVPLQQNLYYVSQYDACIALCWVVYDGSSFSVDESVTEAVFTINADKTEIALQGTSFANTSLGAWWTDDHTFQNYGDYESVYTPYEPKELVEVPEGIETTQVYITSGNLYVNTNDGFQDYTSRARTINVAIDGTDIYIQGLAYWFEDAWIKGTIDGNQAIFPASTFVGNDEYGDEYLVASDDNSTVAEDLVFSFSANPLELTMETGYLVESGYANRLAAYAYYEGIVLSATAPVGPEVVVAPEGLETEEYVLKAVNEKGESVSELVYVGINGGDVYVQGINTLIPEAWVVGTMDGNTLTFAANQYMGTYIYSGLSGDAEYQSWFSAATDIVFTYDAEAGTFTADQPVKITDEDGYVDIYYGDLVLTKFIDAAAVPANPVWNNSFAYDEGNGYGDLWFSVPMEDVDGNFINENNVYNIIYFDSEEEPFVFTPGEFTFLDENTTEIPYTFVDGNGGYDFQNYFGGRYFYINHDFNDAKRIGVQTVYYGGGERKVSEIVWFQCIPDAITLDNAGLATFCFGNRNLVVASEGAVANAAVYDASASRVVLNEVAAIPQRAGVIIKGEPNAQVEFAVVSSADAIEANDLVGCVEDTYDYASGAYVLSEVDGEEGFYQYVGAYIPAGKAYLAPVSSESKIVIAGGEATGINVVEKAVFDKAPVYNLNGQRVNKAQKGVYIMNGKKVILK